MKKAISFTASQKSPTHDPPILHTRCRGIPTRPASSGLGTARHHSSASFSSPPLPNPYHKVAAGVMGYLPDKPIQAKVLAGQPLYRPQYVSRGPPGRSLALDIAGTAWVTMG